MPLADLIKKKLRPGEPKKLQFRKPPAPQQTRPPAAASPRKRPRPLREFEEELNLGGEAAAVVEVDQEALLSQSSDLALSLDDVLGNPSNGAIGYFVQYLEARDACKLLKFWLDVEGFKASSSSSSLSNSRAPPSSTSDLFPSPAQSPAPPEEEDEPGDEPDEDAGMQEKEASPKASTSDSAESFDSGCPGDAASAKQLQRSKDALEIYGRFIAPDCPYPIALDTPVTHAIVQGICPSGSGAAIAATCFDAAQAHVVAVLERDFFPDFLRSEGHAKHLVDVLTGGDGLRMSDVLHHDELLFHFMEFMDGEGDRDLLEFWMAANNFRRQSGGDPGHLKEDALVIYERFISMQASSALGKSHVLSFKYVQYLGNRVVVVLQASAIRCARPWRKRSAWSRAWCRPPPSTTS